jgi:hypothetical protein
MCKRFYKFYTCAVVGVIIEYNYKIKAQYNYDIFNSGFLEECEKKENVAVTGTATTSCLKIRFYNFCPMWYSRSHCQAGNPNDKYRVNTSQRFRFV